ncbi:iron uptake transporter permease EfeU [Rosenbergiella australiborealis]
MLATLVIALREGLEAVLIVSIIATFLRKNQQALAPMWWGVSSAVLLSALVGIGLSLTERALPQAQQEAMEAIIGAIAIVFVSSMIIWMQQHAPQLHRELENEASAALSRSSHWALPMMAFLAVLKEGFETSVFLLATFSAAQSTIWAAIGALVGLLLALIIGWGIYRGGVRLNLGRFFRITGIFLILVAAGLVVSALRSAHEAGWLLIGQQKLLNLDWLVPPGSIRAALISGVLGIPTDPRRIEVIGWMGYLGFFTLLLSWPERYKPSPTLARRLYQSLSIVMLVGALFCARGFSTPVLTLPTHLPLVVAQNGTGEQPIGELVRQESGIALMLSGQPPQFIPLPSSAQDPAVTDLSLNSNVVWQAAPAELTLDQVAELYHHRIPPGLHPQQHPGPYQSQWQLSCQIALTLQDGQIIAAAATPHSILALSGSGLPSPRLLNVTLPPDAIGCPWQPSQQWQQQLTETLANYRSEETVIDFIQHKLPIVLIVISLGCLLLSLRNKKNTVENYSTTLTR